MYESILVPVDGSEPSRSAVDRALSLAETVDATLSLLTVIKPATLPTRETSLSFSRRAALDTQPTETLEYAESAAADAGVDYSTAVEVGTPYEEIRSRTDDEDVDLIAMGTHGRSGIDRLLLGSVAERTLRTSDVPVLTTGESEQGWAVDDVLVPTDGSGPATEAVDDALEFASACDATIHALSVVNTQMLAPVYHAGAGLSRVTKSLREQRERDVEAIRDRAVDYGLDCNTTVLDGLAGRAIPRYAGDKDMDLVVMGTHGRTGFKRAFLGSVTESTIRSSPAPVLAVPSVDGPSADGDRQT
jgi:nucleotide-binding universal stress UspA family protein